MAGTIRKRGKNTYRLEICMGHDSNGKAKRFSKTVHVPTKKEAERELAAFYLECEKNSRLETINCTLSDFIDILWWKDYVILFTKRSTWQGYRTATEVHIKPALGNTQLKTITDSQIQNWINGMIKDDLSAKTIKNYYSVLNNIMKYAVKLNYIYRNPCEGVTLPKSHRTESSYYTALEVRSLLEALNDVSDDFLDKKVAIYLALFGGLRKGEILGLNEDDVLFDTNQIQVHRNRMIAPEIGPYEDSPKTEESIRVIRIPQEIMDMIKLLLLKQQERKEMLGNKWRGSKALIKGVEGGPLYPQNLQRWFTSFLQKNDLPHLGLHGLRHTHTAMLASMTDDIAQISKRLGHSNLTTTLNIYTHLYEDRDKKLVDDMSQQFLCNLSSSAKINTGKE